MEIEAIQSLQVTVTLGFVGVFIIVIVLDSLRDRINTFFREFKQLVHAICALNAHSGRIFEELLKRDKGKEVIYEITHYWWFRIHW